MSEMDNAIKSTLNLGSLSENQNSKSTDLLFDQAWNKYHRESKTSMWRFSPRLATACTLAFIMIFTTVPPLRTFAQTTFSHVASVFFVKTNGEVLLGDDTLTIPYYNMGGEKITADNRSYFESLLGCTYMLPQTIYGESVTYHHRSYNSFGITLFNMNYKYFDEKHIEIYNQIIENRLADEHKNVDFMPSITTSYYLEGTDQTIYARATNPAYSETDSVKQLHSNLQSVDITEIVDGQYFTKTLGNYHKKEKVGWLESDMTKEPIGIDTIQYIKFTYKGTSYQVTAGQEPSDTAKEQLLKFAKAFIESARPQSELN